jgi:cysteine desulfurase/selenocysteine lyase
MPYDINAIREDFPATKLEVHSKPLIYLDNGASAQKPRRVIDTITRTYESEYANVHRGLHYLSNLATENYEAARGVVQKFLGAAHEDEIIFTRGSTEAINLAMYSWLEPRIEEGDEIVLTTMEHHANIVPWHFMRERFGAKLIWVDPDVNGDITAEAIGAVITERTKLVAVTHMSNVLGTVVDVKRVTELAHAAGAAVMVDGSQGAVHLPVDVQDIGCDFYCITGHKLYGPSGSGALYAKRSRHDEMRPWHGGGDMIRHVRKDEVTYNVAPHKFEAGTPPIAQIIGMAEAIRYMQDVGMQAIADHEHDLRDYTAERLAGLNWLHVQGKSETKGAIFSFTMEGAHAHDISTVLDRYGVAVRAGHHCCQPLMEHLGVNATCRASFGMYNNRHDADALVTSLEKARMLFE